MQSSTVLGIDFEESCGTSLETARGAMRFIVPCACLLLVALLLGASIVDPAAASSLTVSATAYRGTLAGGPRESAVSLVVGTVLLALASMRGRRPRM